MGKLAQLSSRKYNFPKHQYPVPNLCLRSFGFSFEFDVVYTSWLSRAIETAWVSSWHHKVYENITYNVVNTINNLFLIHVCNNFDDEKSSLWTRWTQSGYQLLKHGV